jgi:hypothetical protein
MRKLLILGTTFLGLSLSIAVAQAADFVAASLSGGNEVPPNASKGRGTATFDLSADGTRIEYQLSVANIDNVTMSHIHMAPAGVNGSIVVFLFGPVAAGGGSSNGVIAKGTITADNLIGPLLGQPLSDLIDAMRTGNAYVNVHTNDGVDPPNTGPGDIQGGEIRAQIRPAD